MRRLWTWYGAVLILAGLWLTSTLLYYAAMRDQVAAQAEWSGASFDEGEFKSHFWAGLFANQQAEWAHLLFTTVVLGGFGYACFRKGRRASLRIEQKLDEVLRRQGATLSDLRRLERLVDYPDR